MPDPPIMPSTEVEHIAKRYLETQTGRLARSHERLRAMVEELTERVAAQSELLSKKAERPAGRISKSVHV